MMARTLADWLAHAERQHTVGIDLGLERIIRVARAMDFEPPDFRPAPQVLIVAGTNGKGSTSVVIEALLCAAGFTTGATLSPHVHRFNERVRINGVALDDAALCAAFAAVESARGDVPLTYFEYSALVALQAFRRAAIQVAVLEVGLGGRLDAFNLVGADVAVITSIGLDHEAFLGTDLEQIGREKAGVMRAGRHVVIGADVTASVLAEAGRLGCQTQVMGRDFEFAQGRGAWGFRGKVGTFEALPVGPLAAYNCALGIAAAGCLTALSADAVRTALGVASLPGRCEAWLVGEQLVVVDVAHNPAGAAFLRGQLEARFPSRQFVALYGGLADKDAVGVVAALAAPAAQPGMAGITRWICVPTEGPRGQSGAELAARVRAAPGATALNIVPADSVAAGLRFALASVGPEDGILAFGAFNLVEVLRDLLARGEATGGAPARALGVAPVTSAA